MNTSTDCMAFRNVLDNFHPTVQQMTPENGEEAEYPSIPYRFGFFAAITIETDNVEIDLNRFTIKQSDIHHIQQILYQLNLH